MDSKVRIRLGEFLLAILLVAGALVWIERMAWNQISVLRREIRAENINRFHLSDELRSAVLERHVQWLRALKDSDHALRNPAPIVERIEGFRQDGNASKAENQLIDRIRDACADYESTMAISLRNMDASTVGAKAGREDQLVEMKLATVLGLIDEFTAIQRGEAQKFLGRSNEGLTQLQRFLFVAFLGLLGCGATLIWFAYRRTIAPLRTNLSESKAIIERQEKLASLGVFAAGIAHEIRNPLTAIKVRLFSLKQSHQPGASEHEDLQVIGTEIDRLERIVKEFLQFARPAELDFQPVQLRELLNTIFELLHSEFAKREIQLKLEMEADAQMNIDPNKMKQVLLNLLQNGAESIAHQGTVTLRSRAGMHSLHGRLQPVIIIEIVDTGSGMPVEIQKRLFDPFFTTKEQGTGLGLPIAARIIEKHGGAIQYETEPQRGTRFSIILPNNTNNERERESPVG